MGEVEDVCTVMVIVVGNEFGDPSPNVGLGRLHVTWHYDLLKRYESKYSPSSYG